MPEPIAASIDPAHDVAAANRAARIDVVYYVRFRDRVKIGTTANLPERLREIPHDALLGVELGGRELERKRHAQFRRLRDIGEWFQVSAELLDHIAALPPVDVTAASSRIEDDLAAKAAGLLVTGPEAASLLGVMPRTIYQWRRRGYLAVRGLAGDGSHMYDLSEVAEVKSNPRQRQVG